MKRIELDIIKNLASIQGAKNLADIADRELSNRWGDYFKSNAEKVAYIKGVRASAQTVQAIGKLDDNPVSKDNVRVISNAVADVAANVSVIEAILEDITGITERDRETIQAVLSDTGSYLLDIAKIVNPL